jgi:hypothetical protein
MRASAGVWGNEVTPDFSGYSALLWNAGKSTEAEADRRA